MGWEEEESIFHPIPFHPMTLPLMSTCIYIYASVMCASKPPIAIGDRHTVHVGIHY